MNAYIQKVAVLFIGIMLFLIVPTSLSAQGNLSLNEALNNNQVEVRISGQSSTYFQPMVVMEIRNLSDQPLEIDLPLASRLRNEQGSACELVVLRSDISPIYLEVLPSDSPPVVYRLFTYCLDLEGQNNISYPSSEATYQPTGELASDEIINVLRNIAQASEQEQEDFAAQIAIWSAATGYDLPQLQDIQGANYSFYTAQVERFLGLDQATAAIIATPMVDGSAEPETSAEPQVTTEQGSTTSPDAGEESSNSQLIFFALVVGVVVVAGLAFFLFMVRQPKRPIPKNPSDEKPGGKSNGVSNGKLPERSYSRRDLCVLCHQPLNANQKCSNEACSTHMPKKVTFRTVDESTDAIPVEDPPVQQARAKVASKPFARVVDTEPLNPDRAKGFLEPTDSKQVEDNLSIKLEVISGDQKGEVYTISGNNQDLQTIISRGEAEQIILEDAKISMPHAVLDVWPENPTGNRIRDLGSKNGTFVNGNKISAHEWYPLKEGDRLEFGTTKLRYDQAQQQLSDENKPREPISLISSTNRWLITRHQIEFIDFNSNDTKISVPHVCVRLNQGLLEVRDISSNNAVKIGNKVVEGRSYLFDQDVIQIGQRTKIKVITDISGIPEVIDQWRRQNLIKHGGMAGIYCVQHVVSGQIAALKIPRPGKYWKDNDLGRKYQTLFEQECTLTHQVQDPNLVEAIARGFIQNGVQLPYLVLKYIDGYSVYSMIEKLHTFSGPNAAEVAFWVAKALQALHKEGYIHCDVKPSNIMIDRQGKVHLIDLGVATRIGETYSGLGRRDYLPKEIYSDREPVNVDTDSYSLGQTLFKMLTTQSLPSGKSLADENKDPGVENTVGINPDRVQLPLSTLLRQKVKEVKMQEIISTCSKETRQDRYQDMQVLLDELQPLRIQANLNALVQQM